jgi:hypothetical protein
MGPWRGRFGKLECDMRFLSETMELTTGSHSSVRRGKREERGCHCALLGQERGVGPCKEREGEGEGGPRPRARREEGEEMSPGWFFHLWNAFLFLFPEFHTKYQRGISNPKMISKDLYHHKFNKQKQTISHMELDFFTVIFIHVKVIFIQIILHGYFN